jgi:dihydropteroate synthase
MQQAPVYDDVVAEVTAFLVERAEAAGVDEVWIDPGIGFGKTMEHNLALLAHLDELVATGFPVMVGTSRKSFLGHLTGGAPVEDRVEASVATAAWALAQGAGMVRVHDVAPTVVAAKLLQSR